MGAIASASSRQSKRVYNTLPMLIWRAACMLAGSPPPLSPVRPLRCSDRRHADDAIDLTTDPYRCGTTDHQCCRWNMLPWFTPLPIAQVVHSGSATAGIGQLAQEHEGPMNLWESRSLRRRGSSSRAGSPCTRWLHIAMGQPSHPRAESSSERWPHNAMGRPGLPCLEEMADTGPVSCVETGTRS